MDETMDDLRQKKEERRGFYGNLGAQSSVDGFRIICEMLAADEMRQEKVIQALQKGAAARLENVATLEGAKAILRRLSLDGAFPCRLTEVAGRLGDAMDFEADCARTCREIAAAAGEGPKRELFLRMAAEEETHFTLLEQMRELVHGVLEE